MAVVLLATTGCSAGPDSGRSRTAGSHSSVAAAGTPPGGATGPSDASTSRPAVSPMAKGVAPPTLQQRCGQDQTLTAALPAPFTFTTADGVTLVGAEFGDGPRGVVALHQLGREGLCGWVHYALYLADHGLHVLAFDHRCVGSSACPDPPASEDLLADVDAAQAELVRRGATSTALLGASQGGGEAIAAAGSRPGWTRAVVLSGAVFTADFGGGVTTAGAVGRLAVPVLFVVATGDRDSPLDTDQALVATAPPGLVTLDVLPTGGHGWSLLQAYPGAPFDPLADQVAAFLAR